MDKTIAIVGGCGHVGLPLGVKLALAGAKVHLVDVDEEKVKCVRDGRFPFVEKGGDEQLAEALELGLEVGLDPCVCRHADSVVFVTGTPVDEHLNPKISEVIKIFDLYSEYFPDSLLVVMRSTLFPGTMEHLHERVRRRGLHVKLAFCPERVAQGHALDEIESLPQIVSAFDEESFEEARGLFSAIAPSIIRLKPIEAELAKLMANSWRYLEFAIANQFYLISESKGLDFARIYDAIRYDYPRARGYKAPGLAAGPCLFKDTMQLASFFDNRFYMGHAAMLVNEGLATHLAEKMSERLGGGLWDCTVGLLGMAFKADNDDIRESLSFKVKKVLEFKGARVLCHDPYIESSPSLEEVIANSDGIVLCTPHEAYRNLDLKVPIVDVWRMFEKSDIEILSGEEAAEYEPSGGRAIS